MAYFLPYLVATLTVGYELYGLIKCLSVAGRRKVGRFRFSTFRYYILYKLHVASIYIYIYMSLIKCSRKEGRLAGDIG